MQVAPAVSQPRFPSALPDQSFDELLIDLEEDRAARAVGSACSLATRSRSFALNRT
jgi:hypothetical protein